ncbi:MAG: hypothetical protein CL862_09510 [Cyanobium sp. NAT70]|nr:hypothetical protein [Cyanobium sp. NAT70]
MTNLSGRSQSQWLSRERVLIAVPLLGGVMVSVVLSATLLRPLLVRVGELQERVDALQAVQQSLPALNRNLAQAEIQQRQAQKQQALLINLIAGTDRIQTFLALLDQEAKAAGVTLLRYEPVVVDSSQQSKPKPRRRSAANNKKTSSEEVKDPLLALGYRKTSMTLRVMGAYAALQDFLQRTERLQVLVESSDLELESVEVSPVTAQDPTATTTKIPSTELGLQFSFYDPLPPKTSIKPGSSDREESQPTSDPPLDAPS